MSGVIQFFSIQINIGTVIHTPHLQPYLLTRSDCFSKLFYKPVSVIITSCIIYIRNLLIIPVPDTNIHALWTHNVDLLVPAYDVIFTNDPFTIALFQERNKKIVQPPLFERPKFSGTKIRENMVKEENWKNLLHFETVKWNKKIISSLEKI